MKIVFVLDIPPRRSILETKIDSIGLDHKSDSCNFSIKTADKILVPVLKNSDFSMCNENSIQ